MALRRATDLSSRAGKSERSSPHYFVLGSSDWSAGLYRNVAEIRLPLLALPIKSTNMTYADSTTAPGLGVSLGLPAPDPYHADRVYQLQDLEQLIARFGPPRDAAPQDPAGYTGYQQHRVDAHIEVQLWSDEPVRSHIVRS